MKLLYINSFNEEKYKMYQFRVKRDDEAVINYLYNLESRNSFILSLIKNEIDNNVYTIKQLKQIIKPVLIKYGINEIYLFGSYARGEASSRSDVDIYCEKGNIKTFFEQAQLEEELKNALKKDVDIIFIGSEMNSYFREQITEDLIKLC